MIRVFTVTFRALKLHKDTKIKRQIRIPKAQCIQGFRDFVTYSHSKRSEHFVSFVTTCLETPFADPFGNGTNYLNEYNIP